MDLFSNEFMITIDFSYIIQNTVSGNTHEQQISPLNARTWYYTTVRNNSTNRIYVGIFATDPIANRIVSHHEQNYIYYLIVFYEYDKWT